jgi:hypothetical protein
VGLGVDVGVGEGVIVGVRVGASVATTNDPLSLIVICSVIELNAGSLRARTNRRPVLLST